MPDPASPPLVSVVVACRNAGKLLRDCLASLVGTAYHHNPSTAWGLLFRHLHYGYGHGLLHRKYPGRRLWDWRREIQAHQDLLRAAAVFGRTAIRSALVGPRPEEELRRQQLDLVRKLGDRIGFVGAALRWNVRPG